MREPLYTRVIGWAIGTFLTCAAVLFLMLVVGLGYEIVNAFFLDSYPESTEDCPPGHVYIDADYRGEIKVCLINHGQEPHTVRPGDRIAQLVIQAVELPEFVETTNLDTTQHGDGGFGSTGQ